MEETIYSYDDLLMMLDSLLKEESTFNWDQFYSDRQRKIPFFKNEPDENAAEYFKNGQVRPGNVLELGCGPGRNAIFFAENGCKVDAVDQSVEALLWAKERAAEKGVNINFVQNNIFDIVLNEGTYDFVF